tara:strand:+ start:668 stop:1003 length:336 start_codon:yes stop_codon:yes gene_type:complete
MFSCVLCSGKLNDEYLFLGKFCSPCNRIKWYISLYKHRPIEILDNVLSRDEDKQSNKEKYEINKEIEGKVVKLSDKDKKNITKQLCKEIKKDVECIDRPYTKQLKRGADVL